VLGRIMIDAIHPTTPSREFPAKAAVGEAVPVRAVIFQDGHDLLGARVRWRRVGKRTWHEAPMRDLATGTDDWAGEFHPTVVGAHEFVVEAWKDRFATWRHDVEIKSAVGDDIEIELEEGARILEHLAEALGSRSRRRVLDAAAGLRRTNCSLQVRLNAGLDDRVAELVAPVPDADLTATDPVPLWVDRPRGTFGAWYELFPRSEGGFEGAAKRLPAVAEMGFDIVYLPPIHPIGTSHRKGANNTLTPAPDDPGSPWAIGGVDGGHRSVHPELGTIADVDALVAAAREVGIEIALDFAIQCSADHPWLTEHPEWFNRRPDGTLKYAENPPKKYQDIYNVNFDCDDWQGLWKALLAVVLYWVDHGITVFRVDNPHTKPVPFWEWLIATVRARHPEVIFLAEAFTKRAMMKTLGKVGFNQSYTYFTWKSSRWELTEYVTELTTSGEQEYFRPNFFVNTPDILTEELALGGEAKFVSRLVLAATLSPSYGVYSGYEHFEATPVRPGSEEYLDSEKYEARKRSLDGPLLPLIGQLNHIRRENPALQRFDDITFLDTENDALIAYAKRVEGNTIITVVSLDPTWPQEGTVLVPHELGTPPSFDVTDLLDGSSYHWQLGRNYVRLVPSERPAHILRLETP
jgi:starch synthase (maltosyl-transferring)